MADVAGYVFDADLAERIVATVRRVEGTPTGSGAAYPTVAMDRSEVQRAVIILNGTPTDGRYLASLQWRTDDLTPGVWLDFDPVILCAAVGYNDEPLEQGKRYPGILVGMHKESGLPVFSVGVGGGSAVTGIPGRVSDYNCANAKASIVLIQPSFSGDGSWQDIDGTVFTTEAFHYQKGAVSQFFSGGPLVAVGTRVFLRPAIVRSDGTQTYVFDCPAGFTGTETVMTDWVCNSGVGTKTIMYRSVWNGQQMRGMTLEPPTGPPCS